MCGFEGGKVVYVLFLEDSYGTAGAFKTGGKTRFHSDRSGKVILVLNSSSLVNSSLSRTCPHRFCTNLL
jgi:hypothetical protein